MPSDSPRRWPWIVAAGLALAVLFLYAPVGSHDWVRYDDEDYLLANPHVLGGLDWEGVRWAFTRAHSANYHPLAWLTHMLDVELFGLDAGAHHWGNVVLHALNAVLVFALLFTLSRSLWASGIAAALFALHPLRVESVAWASERKDVLCATFFLLAQLAYLRHERRPSHTGMAWVGFLFLLALLSKPMAVTLPVVLLLLDVRTRGRTAEGSGEPKERAGGLALALEKWPLFALAAVMAFVTLRVQSQAGSTSSISALALDVRGLNALRSLGVYLGQSLFPRDLSVFYPHAAITESEPVRALLLPATLGAGLLLLGLGLAWRARRSAPLVTVGIGFFMVTLLPVIGLLQVGTQAHADRYTYLPSVGLVIALVGAARALGPRASTPLVAVGLAGALALAGLTRRQISHWRDTKTLFEHALAVDPRNYLAHTFLGEEALEEGDEPRARAAFLTALEIYPQNATVLNKLALCHLASGQLDEARARLEEALRLEPEDPDCLLNLGVVQMERGATEEARGLLETCLARAPSDPSVLFNLGVLEQRTGALDEAENLFLRVLELDPAHVDAWSNLGQVRLALGRAGSAVEAFERAQALAPEDPLVQFNTGIARRTKGDLEGARRALRRALELAPDFELARTALQATEGEE